MASKSEYNPLTGLIELVPDGGGGWMKGYRPIDAAPPGTVRAVYIKRFWVEGIAPNSLVTLSSPGWNLAAYMGYGWGSAAISTTDIDVVDGLWGVWGGYPNPVSSVYLNSLSADPVKQDFASLCGEGTSYHGYLVSGIPGNFFSRLSDRFTYTSGPSDATMPSRVFPIGQTRGQECTVVWEVLRDEGTNRIRMNGRLNTSSLDLDNTDFDATDPLVAIQASNGWEFNNYEIMSDIEYGASNPWIQVDEGDISWPTHFLVRWPFGNTLGLNFKLDKIITKYYQTI